MAYKEFKENKIKSHFEEYLSAYAIGIVGSLLIAATTYLSPPKFDELNPNIRISDLIVKNIMGKEQPERFYVIYDKYGKTIDTAITAIDGKSIDPIFKK